MSTIAERVAAGAAFLDEHDPDWWRADAERAIDLDTLYQGSSHRCVLGQRCPLETLTAARQAAGDGEWAIERYDAYAAALFGADALDVEGSLAIRATELGFAWLGSSGNDARFDDLTAEWKRLIEARRSA